jgi:hypothetical protein
MEMADITFSPLFFSATPVALPADLRVKQPAVNQGVCEILRQLSQNHRLIKRK